MKWAWLTPNLLLGPDPWSADDLQALKKQKVSAILSLQTDEDREKRGNQWEEDAAVGQGLVFRNVPVRDFDPADLQDKLPACVAALDELVAAGHTVYVHCTAGVSRSPTVIVAYFHWCQGWPLERAFAHVKELRPCAPSAEAILTAGWHGKT